MKKVEEKMRKMMLIATTILISLSIDLKAERIVDYASWLNLPDKAFIDSLKKYEGKYYKLGDDEYRKKGKDYNAPLVSEKFPKKYIPKGFDIKAHFKDYLAYFNTLNLYGVDPYRLYYNRINIKKIDEFKKAGFDILKIYNMIFLPNITSYSNSYFGIFDHPVIAIGTCKRVINDDDKRIHQEFEIIEVLKDNFDFYHVWDILMSSSYFSKKAMIEMHKLSGFDYKYLFNRKEISSGDSCLLVYPGFISDQEININRNEDKSNPYIGVGFTIIRNGKLGNFNGEERDLNTYLKDLKLFEKINDVRYFYNRSYK